jgi:phosphopantothenoylcysteine decarboxylase/phosphopantothenate--cysteine ligase
VLVAFALETGDDAAVLGYAKKKLAAKKVDLVVANAAHESLGKATNRVALVGGGANEASPEAAFVSADKAEIADLILDRVAARTR